METRQIRVLALFYSHLLAADVIPWTFFSYIHITESTTSSSSRIFIKILLQDLQQNLGLDKLVSRLLSKEMEVVVNNTIFPMDNAVNARFAINFFVTIKLGRLTERLRSYLNSLPKVVAKQDDDDDSDSSSSSSSGSSSSSSSGSSSDSDSSKSSKSSDSRQVKKAKKH
jgi:pre-mRNA-splicing factor CWC22